MPKRLLAALFFGPLLAQDPVAVDPQHYTVALDNSRVRVLRVHYRPGEGSPMHTHTAGVRVFLTDIHNKFFLPDGSTSEASRKAGEIIWSEPVRHGNRNVGANSVEILEMELKDLPDHPAHAMRGSGSVVLENEFVRVLRGPPKGALRAQTDRVLVRSGGEVTWAPANAEATADVVVELK